jgi:hypothetical protein
MSKNSKESQHDKFVKVARELETDESEKAFDAILKKIAKIPPKDETKPRKEK